jgi:pimeloyl-ACP methyl ester carboxylesterase
MRRSDHVDGFSLAYDQRGSGPAVVLLHGWPGDRHDWRDVVAQLDDAVTTVVPDLRGFGESDTSARDPAPNGADPALHGADSALHGADPALYGAAGQAASVLGLIDELALERPVIAGYDVGSRTAQQLARTAPERVGALVLAPPLPGVGDRVLAPEAQTEFWYQPFHRLELSGQLLDGDRAAVRAYLEHFWSHWSGPSYTPDSAQLDRLADAYARPGAFTASIGWYRSGSGTVATSLAERAPAREDRIRIPTTVLWPEHDPLFPPAWGDRLEEFFADVTREDLPGVGHFSPLEAPARFAAAITAAAARH